MHQRRALRTSSRPQNATPRCATMKFYRQVMFTLRIEAGYFLRFPRLRMAALVVIGIPALYTLIYLSSAWDPASRTGALPVALVNLDQGVAYRGQLFNAGLEVTAALRKKHTFGYVTLDDEAVARSQVRSGTLAFALIIPRDFSSNAIPGHDAGAGKLVVYISEGNNFESAMIAKDFAHELGHDVNENLNERRWQLVLLSAAGSQRNVEQLHIGVDQLHRGARELSKGLGQLSEGTHLSTSAAQRMAGGVTQLTLGLRQLGSGIRTMEAKHPRATDLERLKTGAEQLAAGHSTLSKGLNELQAGSQRIRAGVTEFREEAHSSLLVPSRVSDGVDELFDGVVKLDTGLQTAHTAQIRIEEGARTLSSGVASLTAGVNAMNSGLNTMVSKLPDDAVLDDMDAGAGALASGIAKLDDGSHRIKAGAARLEAGLHLLSEQLPATIDKPDGSASGLANSVQPILEISAPVPNSGSALAPNVIPAALWLGAGIAAFLIHLRVLPKHAQYFSRPAQLTGKLLIPLLIVLLQAALVYLSAVFGLHIRIAEPGHYILALALSSFAFLAIVFALTRAFGDAGKGLSMIFLAVQLSSSGGIMPVELSGGLYSDLSPWLPLTWVVRCMKATMFGAYGGDWLRPLAVIGISGLIALCCACWVGRWRYVQPAQMRPTVDF